MLTDSSILVTTLRILDDEIILNAALKEEQNMLRRLIYWDKRINFLIYLLAEIETVVSYHLSLSEIFACRQTIKGIVLTITKSL